MQTVIHLALIESCDFEVTFLYIILTSKLTHHFCRIFIAYRGEKMWQVKLLSG